jgi:hypothetical protein
MINIAQSVRATGHIALSTNQMKFSLSENLE